MLAVHVAGRGQREGELYCDLQVVQLMLVVLVIVHQGVGSEDNSVQLRLALFQ